VADFGGAVNAALGSISYVDELLGVASVNPFKNDHIRLHI